MRVAVTSSMRMSVAVVTVTVTFVLMGVTSSSSMGMTVVPTAAVGMAVTCPTVLTKKEENQSK